MNELKDLIAFAASQGATVHINIQWYSPPVASSPPAAATADSIQAITRNTGLTPHGIAAVAAITNGTVHAKGKSLRWLQLELNLPSNALYRDSVFKRMYKDYQASGRMEIPKGVWDVSTESYDAMDYDE